MLAGAAAARPLAATCMRRAGGRGAVSCRAQAPDAAEGGEEEDTSDTEPGWRCERSGRVAGEFMLFVFGTQLAVAEQRSLNEGAYEVAKAVRERQEEINALVSERKSSPGSLRAVEGELMDRQARCAVLRNQLDAAVREERYRDAAGLRDQLNDAESFLAATAAAPGAGKPVFAFTLGQRVQHSRWGWVGTVAGCEAGCSEGEEWSARVGLGNRGREQPFYVCLPDAACIDGATEVLYVAEEALQALPPSPPAPGEQQRMDVHALVSMAFLGRDAVGGFVPTRALRELWAQPRRDVWPPDSSAGEDEFPLF